MSGADGLGPTCTPTSRTFSVPAAGNRVSVRDVAPGAGAASRRAAKTTANFARTMAASPARATPSMALRIVDSDRWCGSTEFGRSVVAADLPRAQPKVELHPHGVHLVRAEQRHFQLVVTRHVDHDIDLSAQ